jgi:hypothetical protein
MRARPTLGWNIMSFQDSRQPNKSLKLMNARSNEQLPLLAGICHTLP